MGFALKADIKRLLKRIEELEEQIKKLEQRVKELEKSRQPVKAIGREIP